MITGWVPLCLVAALTCWPGPPTRLRAAVEPPPARSPRRRPGSTAAVRLLLPVALAGLFAGPGGAVAAGILTAAWCQEWRTHRRSSAELAVAAHAATALRTMVAELRAGAHPVGAAEAAAEAVPALSGELRSLAGAVRLDGELHAAALPALPGLAVAWALGRRYGLPMADVLDAARRDVEAGLRYARRMRAKMAGPRASAAVLTGLPVLCVLLGEAMGATPVRVLTATVPGQLLLVTGSLLLWAGTAWCRVLTGRARVR